MNALRVGAIRSLMATRGWDAVVLRGQDPHCSEYPAPRYTGVTWVSGFTGEAGDLVITMSEAGLWTDSRYFVQAERQLQGTGITLHKTRLADSVDIPHYLAESECRTVACDSLCESAAALEEIREVCNATPGFRLEGVPDLLDEVWEGRPGLPVSPIITLDGDSVGMTREEKINWLRSCLGDDDYILLGVLDEIAWMLNVRGSDIEYNPLVISYLLIGRDSVQWFVLKEGQEHPDEDSADSFAEVEADGVSVENYDAIAARLRQIAAIGDSVAYDPCTLNACLAGILASAGNARPSPVPLRKGVKTKVEIEGFREAFLEDGLAVEKFLYWLEKRLEDGPVSEWEAALTLEDFRREIPGYRGGSFETISAWGPGAALPHYSTPKDGSSLIQPHGLYLCDSGGQYVFGTTDITRTVPTGPLTQLEMEDYTLVLQGMIELSLAVFPYGTAGCQIDALAREPLWKKGRNFGHGTGHGIGFFLCVHEGPQSIRQNFLTQPLLPGMVTSNEPGLYREGMHGVRHENVILCKDAFSNEFGRWLDFETLTLCHFDTSALLPGLLTVGQKQWLDNYNEKVYRTFAPALEDEDLRQWLYRKTRPAKL